MEGGAELRPRDRALDLGSQLPVPRHDEAQAPVARARQPGRLHEVERALLRLEVGDRADDDVVGSGGDRRTDPLARPRGRTVQRRIDAAAQDAVLRGVTDPPGQSAGPVGLGDAYDPVGDAGRGALGLHIQTTGRFRLDVVEAPAVDGVNDRGNAGEPRGRAPDHPGLRGVRVEEIHVAQHRRQAHHGADVLERGDRVDEPREDPHVGPFDRAGLAVQDPAFPGPEPHREARSIVVLHAIERVLLRPAQLETRDEMDDLRPVTRHDARGRG